MQTVPAEVKAALDRYTKIRLALYVNGVQSTAPIVSCIHTATAGGAGSWSIGSATAAQVSIRTDGENIAAVGDAIRVTWSVYDTEYPLFSGTVDSVDEETITAYDALYGATAALYQPVTSATTAGAVLALLGIPVESGTAVRAAAISLPKGTQALGEGMSLAGAIGAVSMLMGGNAVVNRAGELEVITQKQVSGLWDTYSGTSKTQKDTFAVTGVALTAGESVYYAGVAPYLGLSNPLGTQALTNGIWTALNGAGGFVGGSVELPAGLLLEPGDVFYAATERCMVTLYASTVVNSIDGGCRTLVASTADMTCGDGGSISQSVRTLEADVARIKHLEADYVKVGQLETEGGVNINGANITAGKITAEHIDADNLTALAAKFGEYEIKKVSAGWSSQGEIFKDWGLAINADGINDPKQKQDSLFLAPDGLAINRAGQESHLTHNGVKCDGFEVFNGELMRGLFVQAGLVSSASPLSVELPAGYYLFFSAHASTTALCGMWGGRVTSNGGLLAHLSRETSPISVSVSNGVVSFSSTNSGSAMIHYIRMG